MLNSAVLFSDDQAEIFKNQNPIINHKSMNMKNLFKISILSFFLLVTVNIKAQVLISLVFGEALNTDKIEFGLIGGLNRSYLNDITESEGLNNFALGFYFHILAKKNSYISTGVWVKSNAGATGMPTYLTGDASIDSLYKDGTLTKKSIAFMSRSCFTNDLTTAGMLKPVRN